MMKLTDHFTLEELTASSTAERLGISNQPNATELAHLRELCESILEPLRLAWGAPIKVTSGFRGEALNKKVGGAKTSAHRLGYAVDIVPTEGTMATFKMFVKIFLKKRTFDQCIDEKNKQGAQWMHIGLFNGKKQQRRQFLITYDAKTYKVDKQ